MPEAAGGGERGQGGKEAPAGGSPAKKAPRGEEKEKKKAGNIRGEQAQLLQLLAKQALRGAQESRDLHSAIIDTWVGDGGSPEANNMGEQNTNYQEQVRKAGKGHQLGPPHVYTFGGLLAGMLTRKDLLSELLVKIREIADWWAAASTQQASEAVKFCRMSKVFNQKQRRLQIAWGPRAAPWSQFVRDALAESQAWEMKLGRAPPAVMERELQEWLSALGGDKK